MDSCKTEGVEFENLTIHEAKRTPRIHQNSEFKKMQLNQTILSVGVVGKQLNSWMIGPPASIIDLVKPVKKREKREKARERKSCEG